MKKHAEQEVSEKQDRLLITLESLHKSFKNIPINSILINEDSEIAITAISELAMDAESVVLSKDPSLYRLSNQLRYLKSLVENLHAKPQERAIFSFIRRNLTYYEIYVASISILTEIIACIDFESVRSIARSLEQRSDERAKIKALEDLNLSVSRGFDRNLQDAILKLNILSTLESILRDPTCSRGVRERSALTVISLIRFNRDVFAGLVVTDQTVRALIRLESEKSIQAVCCLIKLVRSPVVDEILLSGELPTIIGFLSSKNGSIRAASMECVFEIGYFGRKNVIESAFEEGLMEKLVELQIMENQISLFMSCVEIFSIQLEVGEGLRRREKRAFKFEILRRVRELQISEADISSITAAVLWGPSP